MRKAKTKRQARLAWSKDEVKLLKELYPDGRAREIAERIGRSLMAVKQKAYHMGIRTREDRRWSAGEIKLLKQKSCRKCKRWKNETGFYRKRLEKDGLTARCQTCSYKPTSKSRKKRLAVNN